MLIIRQLPASARPAGHGRPLAVLPMEPVEFANVEFEHTVDGLDELDAADVEIEGGWVISLARYRGAPQPGTNVYVFADEAQMPAALAALLEAAQIERSRVPWVSPLAEQ